MNIKPTTTQRGYGHDHRTRRDQLLYQHIDGTECEYCARPMYRDATRNFDGAPLEADHLDQDKGNLAARLLHRQCNRKMSQPGTWVKHGPEWYAAHGQAEQGSTTGAGLHYPGGRVITWIR